MFTFTVDITFWLSFVFKELFLGVRESEREQSKIKIVPLCEALAVPFGKERLTGSRSKVVPSQYTYTYTTQGATNFP